MNFLGLLISLFNDLLYPFYWVYFKFVLRWQNDNVPDPDPNPSASRQSAKVVGVGRVGTYREGCDCTCPRSRTDA